MSVKLLSEHHLEFLSVKVGCTGSSESNLVKMPHCLISHAAAHLGLDENTCLWGFGNNTVADQPAHPCRLISAFVISLSGSISRLATSKISIF